MILTSRQSVGESSLAMAETPRLTDSQFAQIRELLLHITGIALTSVQRTMTEARLLRRLGQLGLTAFDEYCRILSGSTEEHSTLIDFLTTNKTDFFREPAQFEFMVKKALPMLAHTGAGTRRPLRVWSAACSTGEEVYTLAMVLGECHQPYPPMLLGTDISSRALQTAVTAVYPAALAQPIPMHLLSKYFLMGRDSTSGLYRVAPEVRRLTRFKRFNLVTESGAESIEPWDFIFCRNVLIYFERATQEAVVRRLIRRLVPGGFLATGHAESLNGFDLPLTAVAPATYRKQL